jgi:hypothetical protein
MIERFGVDLNQAGRVALDKGLAPAPVARDGTIAGKESGQGEMALADEMIKYPASPTGSKALASSSSLRAAVWGLVNGRSAANFLVG